jgi:HPt (histidine-containing phosphotransfer) domain-containing protein
MQKASSDKFVFHESLNSAFLDELFDGDTAYAETVFEDFLNDLPSYWLRVETSFQTGNLPALGMAIHTCKTLFGYVGFTDLQELCQEFENSCANNTREGLRPAFESLRKKKDQAQHIIENEYERLSKYNRQHT